jgi:hypothetical protein
MSDGQVKIKPDSYEGKEVIKNPAEESNASKLHCVLFKHMVKNSKQVEGKKQD